MLDLESVMHGAIPAVDPGGLQRLWVVQSQDPSGSASAFSTSAISQQTDSDPIAVWARLTLIGILLQQGILENWRTSEGLQQVVFQSVAVFPLPNGLQGLDPDEFIASLLE